MPVPASAPLIGIPADVRAIKDHPFHVVAEKYIRAVVEAAGGLPMLIPALGGDYVLADLTARLDGLLVPGSPSNVAVHHYGGPPDRPDSPQDPQRDATTLPLLRAALAAGLPLFCICRGMQELNVALGGTLHTQLHLVEGRIDHRSDPARSYEERYGPRHPVRLEPTGIIARLTGKRSLDVNSLHWQGVDRLGQRLVVEAVAEDGTVEAVRVEDAGAFALAVQWHPEFRACENPDSLALFRAFGEAARARAAARRHRAGLAA
ncbi:MAG: gamma-glutamyl-gamma-aminobutyrate hydrolase family protein [Rhodospirillaceae bacterium]|nr:gamma-glutamyl-gamma-aminobutyrate hydrolase family protein [Rhodospirillaceae bacterium]